MIVADTPVLTGRRVTLRPYSAGFNDDELGALYRWGIDQQIIDLAGGSTLDMSFNSFRDIFLRQLPRRNGDRQQLFAILDEQGVMIGRIGLFGFDPPRSAELGIVIGERDRWGRGYGRDAVTALCDYAFDVLGLDRVVLYTFLDNERAQRAFAACGFQPTRRMRRFSLERGMHTELQMELRRGTT